MTRLKFFNVLILQSGFLFPLMNKLLCNVVLSAFLWLFQPYYHSEADRLREQNRGAWSQRTTDGQRPSWCRVVLALVQQGRRTQCCSSDEESSAAPLPSTIPPVHTLSPGLTSHSAALVSSLQNPLHHPPHPTAPFPSCTLPMWSMACVPAGTCWDSGNREYLQISQMGLSSATTAHSPLLVNHCKDARQRHWRVHKQAS